MGVFPYSKTTIFEWLGVLIGRIRFDAHLMPQARALYNADRWDTSEPYLQYASAMVERTLASGAFALNICHEDLLEPLVRICHSKNLPLYVWTVDEAVRMRQLLQMGVSSITTHDVELLRAVLAEH